MQTKDLTKAEEQVMQILWQLEKGFVNDVIAQMPEPKPAYNTVSTIIRILEKKGFVAYEAFGKSHRYYALVSMEEYTDKSLNSLMKGYFGNSYHNLVSYFTKAEKVSVADLEAMRDIIDQELKNKDGGKL